MSTTSSSLAPPLLDTSLLRRPASPRRAHSHPTAPSRSHSRSRAPASNSPTSSRPSSPHLHPTFAPPFYNRPPTPLPPSPSLTSLLRPSSFTTPSRPTTPDSSDSEAITQSSHLSQRTPRYAPKVPTYEYYGFVLYVLANLCAMLYILWAFAPKEWLGAIGVTYYPSRWWALAIPAYIVMVIVYVYVALAAWNVRILTRPLSHAETVADVGAKVAAIREGGEEDIVDGLEGGTSEKWGTWRCDGEGVGAWKEMWSRGTDAVMDVPLGGVCEVLYGEGRVREEWEEEEGVV